MSAKTTNDTMSIIAGSPQSATVGAAFATGLEVQVLDQYSNPVAGVSVTFTAPSSGASGTFASGGNCTSNPQTYSCVATTDASGDATASTFTANHIAGSNYSVTTSASGVASPPSFSLTNTAKTTNDTMSIIAGSPQSATVGAAFATGLEVQVLDQYSNPVAGVSVTFAAPSSGASGTFASGGNCTSNPQTYSCVATTDASGDATASTFTANHIAGSNYSVTTSASGVASPPSFSLTNTAKTTNDTMSIIAGSPQSATVGAAFATGLEVQVLDQYSNPVAGVSVTFTAPSSGASGTFASGGNCTSNPQTYSCVATTNASGDATASTFTANHIAGSNYSVTTSASGVASPPSFSLTNTAGTANKLAFVQGPSNVTADASMSPAVTVQVEDTYGNPVSDSGVLVTLASSPSVTFSGNTATTSGGGLATFSSLVFDTVGSYTLSGTGGGLTGTGASGSFSVSAKTTNDTMSIIAGSPQSATVGAAFATGLEVQVLDQYSNPVAGVSVTFTAPSSEASGTFASGGNCTSNPQTYSCVATTNASGDATASTFTANHIAGSNYSVTTSASGVASPPSFSLTNTAGTATTIAISSGDSQTTTVSTNFTNPLVALVTDSSSNPVSGATVVFTAPSSGASGTFLAASNGGTCLASGGSAQPSCTATTSSNGLASSLTFTANATAGSYNVAAASSGTTPSPLNFPETNTGGGGGGGGAPPPPASTMITQTAPLSSSTTLAKSTSFTDTLATTGNTGAVTFVTTSAPPGSAGGIRVSSSGVVTTTGALSAGTYKASGTDSDSSGDTGTWSFSLTLSAAEITQVAPTTGTTTTAKAFTSQLEVSGAHGAVTYAQVTGAPHLTVSSLGKVSAPATLAAGTYKAAGTVKDTSGNTGSWSFALTVTANKLIQVAPTTGTTTTAKAFTSQLEVSGAHGTVTYAQVTGAPHLTVSSLGKVSAPATLAAGTYKAAGTVKDTSGNTGSWSFALTVTASKLIQVAPTTGTTTTAKAFTSQLEVSGAHGTVTYAQVTGAPHLTVSSLGKVSAPATLAAGTYKAAGTVKDTSGNTGSWSFALTVTASKLIQVEPTTATSGISKVFTGQLGVSGSHGTVTYSQSAGSPDLKISASGAVSAPATLPAGTYKATGTVKDGLGDTGAWSFALTVTANKLIQVAPTTATNTPGRAFTGQLEVSGARGSVTYTQGTGAPHLTVSSSGKISAPATLAAGISDATGTMKDTSGDTGNWSFALTVTASKLIQEAPTTATTGIGRAFTDQLEVSGARGSVTYTQGTGAPHLSVSSSGKISAPATLTAGTYDATGTVKDTSGDTGNWSFALTVTANKLIQVAPNAATVPTGKVFTARLAVSGAHGTVAYAQSTGAPHLTVSSSGKISAPATLVPGTYKAAGAVKDSSGDTGTWSFTLTVVATDLTQLAPAKGATATTKGFSSHLEVSGAHGTVTYSQSTGAPI